ncbi:acetyltransferase [Salsuginibacillus kocurii]|uniref:acetyltransferase n=1 Tax=Salsuginibacillus kocurii TaxID=427078 RepID=UPI000379A1EC|nr:acetyltransferase [Salsuginibacillus kocurii]
MKKKVILIGNGGHAKVVKEIIDLHPDWRLEGVLDDNASSNEVLGEISLAPELAERDQSLYFHLAVGDNIVRNEIFEEIGISHERYATLVHPTAVLSPSASIGYGAVLIANTVVNTDTVINNHVIVNTSSSVGHDCKIGNFVHISPQSGVTGGSVIEEGAQLGAGSIMVPNTTIGKFTTVGAGSVVTRDLPANCTAVGSPAKPIKYHVKDE